jgi:30S ribosomal protein 3
MNIEPLRLRLKIAWFENFLGLAIDQVNSNQQHFLTPYYFWPKTEAWEQLKLELDSKTWLTQEEKIRILKITRDVMGYWRSYRNTRTIENFKEDFQKPEIFIVNSK